jgi:hypothetical protein
MSVFRNKAGKTRRLPLMKYNCVMYDEENDDMDGDMDEDLDEELPEEDSDED